MKKVLFFFSILVLLTGVNDLWAEGIDYNNHAISREISRTFDIDSFTLKELDLSLATKGKIHQIQENLNVVGFVYIGRTNGCRSGGCSEDEATETTQENFEFFDYVMVLDTTGTIQSVKVFNYQASYGQEVCTRWWLKQFIGYTGEKPLIVGMDIDAISGATISVFSLTTNIEYVTHQLRLYLLNQDAGFFSSSNP